MYWQSSASYNKWPAPYRAMNKVGPQGQVIVAATKFHGTGCMGSHFGTNTMLYVLGLFSQSGYSQLGAYICAALLNAQAGLTPVLKVSDVKDLWNDCVSRGYYEPTAGVQWSPRDIVMYLQTTMPN